MKLDDLIQSEPPTETNEIHGDEWNISLPKTRIHTLDQLIKFCKVDLNTWEVERFICNKWEMGYKDAQGEAHAEPLYQIKAYLRRNKAASAAKSLLAEFREKAAKYSPKNFPSVPKRRTSGVLAELSIFDHHFGAHIWGKETGGADYDLSIAKQCYEDAVASLIARVRGYSPEKALLVIGQDQENSDNRQGATEKLTPQDMDTRYEKVATVSRDATVWATDVLLGEFGAVDIVVVPGNHNRLTAWHLGEYLKAWYRKTKTVSVHNAPTSRKYYEWGVNMLMFAHGDKGKLEDYGKTMAAEQPEMWGRTKHREAHTGDKHQRRLIELPGAIVRILPSLRPPDAWTSDNHFIGAMRAAEGYLWDKTEGLVGTAVHSIL